MTGPGDPEHRPPQDQLLPAPLRAAIQLNSIKRACDIGGRGNGVRWVAGRAQGRACSQPLGRGWGGGDAPITWQPGLRVGAQLPAPYGVPPGASARGPVSVVMFPVLAQEHVYGSEVERQRNIHQLCLVHIMMGIKPVW